MLSRQMDHIDRYAVPVYQYASQGTVSLLLETETSVVQQHKKLSDGDESNSEMEKLQFCAVNAKSVWFHSQCGATVHSIIQMMPRWCSWDASEGDHGLLQLQQQQTKERINQEVNSNTTQSMKSCNLENHSTFQAAKIITKWKSMEQECEGKKKKNTMYVCIKAPLPFIS